MTQITAETIANALGKAKRVGEGWMCLCPAHADNNPSLSIKDENGKILVHCFANCNFELRILPILKARSLWPIDRAKWNDIEAVYPYHNEDGVLLYEVVRKFGKQFYQRRPDGLGGYINKLDDTRRVLYCLPEILAAKAEGKVIYIVEGEKDVECMKKAGVTATTNVGGACKWKVEYNQFLNGANVILCGDNDEIGLKNINLIARSLNGIANSIGIISIPKEFSGRGIKDISDYINAGGLLEQLKVEDCSKVASDETTLSNENKPILSIQEYVSMHIEKPAFLFGDWCTEGMPVLISAPAKCGKSFFGYSLMYNLSIGEAIFGWACPIEGVAAAIIDGEMRRPTIQQRLKTLISSNSKQNNLLKIVDRETLSNEQLSIPDLRNIKEVRDLLDKIGPVKAILFDNINCLFPGGDENSPLFWHDIEALLLECKRRNIAAFVIHHNPKSRIDSPAGSSKSERIPEAVIILQKIGNSAGKEVHFNVVFKHLRDLSEETDSFSARLVKSSDGVQKWEVGQYLEAIQDELGQAKKVKAKNMFTAGMSVRAISNELGVPKSTVGDWVSEVSGLLEPDKPDSPATDVSK